MTDTPDTSATASSDNAYYDVGCTPLIVLSTRLGLFLSSAQLELSLTGGPREILFEGVQPGSVPGFGEARELPIEGAPQKPLEQPRVDTDPWVLDCQWKGTSPLRRILVVVAANGRITTGTLVTPAGGGDPTPVTKIWPEVGDDLFRYVVGVLTG